MRAYAILSLLALSAALAADGRAGAFGVGVLRRDGIIVPFAAFDGKTWSTPWPPPVFAGGRGGSGDLTVPINVAGVPSRWWGPTGPLETWQTWTEGSPRTVRVQQPDWMESHCTRQIGLRTDYAAAQPAPPRTVQPYPKDGLAVSPPQALERIEILPIASPESRAIIGALLPVFNRAERETEERFGHPVARRSREGVQPDVEAIYAVGSDPRFYYVEAVRRYRDLSGSAECSALGWGSGWFVRETLTTAGPPRGDSTIRGAMYTSPLMTVDILNCDRTNASYMLPLGAVRANDKLYWLAQFSGWRRERYVVLDMTPKKVQVVINKGGGGC
jgi:hypothetical protein